MNSTTDSASNTMAPTPDLNALVAAKSDPRLRAHLASTDLTPLSRLAPARLAQTAFPHVAAVELVPGDAYATHYAPLYERMFHGGERERAALIVDRLRADFAGRRPGLAPYRVVGLRDDAGEALAAAQFSVLFLPGGSGARARRAAAAVPYLQYIYVRPENRRQDLSELLHTLVLGVAAADAEVDVRDGGGGGRGEGGAVPFTLFETEPPCHGSDETHRAHAEQRTKIHARSGSLALMLRGEDGRVVSAHVQPGLEVGEGPLTLIWALRANPATKLVLDGDGMGKAVLAAYYRSLRDEGFPEENIALAERMAEARCVKRKFLLMPLADVTKEMYVGIDSIS